tara:strand:- start:4736 stop:5398 length:663 start_codon:yes stop_codon:yes gene_type:complete
MNPILIIDFDSTFIQDETLDEIANLVADNNQKKEIKNITNQAMEGKIDFGQALKKRVEMLKIHKRDIENIIKILEKRVSLSFVKNKSKLRSISERIYIVSGGFKEIIIPIVSDYGISKSNVYANEFIYNDKDYISGINAKSPMSYSDGKIRALKEINFTTEAFVIGDGSTDLEMKTVNGIRAFICFTENIVRKSVSEKADYVASNLDEVFQIIEASTFHA